jgi:hypothetical protein
MSFIVQATVNMIINYSCNIFIGQPLAKEGQEHSSCVPCPLNQALGNLGPYSQLLIFFLTYKLDQ